MAQPPAILTSVQNPADLINAALVRIGYKLRIGSLYDGSPAASACLDLYGQTRDQMLRDGDWGFARRDVSAVLLKQAPAGGYVGNPWNPTAYPPLGYIYQYEYPSDALKIRGIQGPKPYAIDFDPVSAPFSTPNDDTYSPPAKVIVCNVANAILTYTGRITNPGTWEASFTEALIAAVARRVTPTLIHDLNAEKLAAQDEAVETGIANVTQG